MKENKLFLTKISSAIDEIFVEKKFEAAAGLIAEAYIKNKKVYTFGTGHSHMLGEELFARAGGWNYITPMLLDEITLSSHPFKSTYIERIAEFSTVILKLFPVSKGDVVIITSNSGRNPLIVQMALEVKKIGAKLIAVTSADHSKSIKSRHQSGKLLKDIADIVIDNKAPAGDAVVEIGGQMTGPISTITDIFIAHQIVISSLKILEKKKIKFDTFISSNLDNQDKRNEKLAGK